jgi:hypothetical protein
MTAAETHMTATTHRVIKDLTVRLAIGALVLGTLILMGVAITQAIWPTDLSMDSVR